MTYTDYTDDLALLENIPTQAGSLLHILEKAAEDISLYMNAIKKRIHTL